MYDLRVTKGLQNYIELSDNFIQSILFHLRQKKLTDMIVKIIKKLMNENVENSFDPNLANIVTKDVSYLLVEKMTEMTFVRTCQTLQRMQQVLAQD